MHAGCVERAGRVAERRKAFPEPDALIVARARFDSDDMKAPPRIADRGVGSGRRRCEASAFDRKKAPREFRCEEARRCVHGRDFQFVAGEFVERLCKFVRIAQERECPISERARIDLGKPHAPHG